MGTKRADCRYPKRHLRNEVVAYVHIEEGVKRIGVSVAIALRHWNGFGLLHGQRGVDLLCDRVATGLDRTVVVRVAPHLICPVGDTLVWAYGRLDVGYHGAAARLPPELLLSHPLEPYGEPGQRHRDQPGFGGHIVGAVLPIATGPWRVDA